MSDVLERAVEVGVRRVTVLDQPGLNHTFDPRKAADVAAARQEFGELILRGYFCYREEGLGGGGTVIREFEPESDVTYVPRMVGG